MLIALGCRFVRASTPWPPVAGTSPTVLEAMAALLVAERLHAMPPKVTTAPLAAEEGNTWIQCQVGQLLGSCKA
jgi:hypothetical protein